MVQCWSPRAHFSGSPRCEINSNISQIQLKSWFLCLPFVISVLSVCKWAVYLHVNLTLLRMKMFLDPQILQNSVHTWRIFSFWRKKLKREKFFFLLCMAYKNEVCQQMKNRRKWSPERALLLILNNALNT